MPSPAGSRPGGVDVHLHPDALARDGRTVLEALIADGRWRTQFETGTSGGGLTAFAGGDRWRWESRLFAGAYDGAPARDRPVYGALRTDRTDHGSAPRFGSAFLRLRPGVLGRTTLCHPDSVFEPEALGTVRRFGAIAGSVATARLDDPLDRYVEAHVHGGVELERDVEALVLDPSFRDTALGTASEGSGVPVEWHPGYVLDAEEIPALAAYRGAEVAAAAARLAGGGALTPRLLGEARASGDLDGTTAKRVWHLLAAHGRVTPLRHSPGPHGDGAVAPAPAVAEHPPEAR